MDFMNTENDEMRVTAPMPGDRIFYSVREEKGRQLYFSMLPKEFQAKPVRMYKGHVFDKSNNPIEAIIQAIDINSGETIVRSSSDSRGSFQILLPSGHEYDFSVFARDGEHLYFSEYLDMLEIDQAERKLIDVELQKLDNGSTLALNDIIYNYDTTGISIKSATAFNRLSYVLKQNSEVNIEVGVFTNMYQEDSVQGYGLTEQDTIVEIVSKIIEVTDSVMSSESLRKVDSLLQVANEEAIIDEDSLRRSVLSYKIIVDYDTIQVEEERVIYHNDRTQIIADEIMQELLNRNIDEARVTAKGYRDEFWDNIEFTDRTGYFVAVRFSKMY
jgi:hypothetical protein